MKFLNIDWLLCAEWFGFESFKGWICLQFERLANLAVHHGNVGVGLLFDGRKLVLSHVMGQVVLGWEGCGEGARGVAEEGGMASICC